MRALILAGGSGTRFWPLSRAAQPKQLVSLWGGKPMIRHTIERVLSWGENNVFVVSGLGLKDATIEAAGLPESQFVFEPAARNTCAAIALGCMNLDPSDIVAVMPSDHFVRDVAKFRNTLEFAENLAENGSIVTLGIEPTRPETGFGYIQAGKALTSDDSAGFVANEVNAFVEKPSHDKALEYLAEGGYFWNAGIFVFRVDTFFAELARQKPEMAASFDRMRKNPSLIATEFPKVEKISVDYAVMEQAKRMAVVPANFGWSDVGHWAALDEVSTVDSNDNIVTGEVHLFETSGSVVYAAQPNKVVTVLGMKDVVIADTPDALLVIPRGRAQDVKTIVEALQREGLGNFT